MICRGLITIIIILAISGVTKTEKIEPQAPLTGYEVVEKEKKMNRLEYLGEFKISHYNGDNNSLEGGSNNCFGEPLREGMVAVDKEVIPLKSTVIIDGKKYIACDVGGGIKGKHIDMYMDVSAEELERLGIKKAKVYVER